MCFQPTIDFYILVEYIRCILSKEKSSENLVKKVITICFKAYAKYVDFKSVFDRMVALASARYPKYLALNSDAMFKYFLKSESNSEYSYQLNSIFPYINIDVFYSHANELFTNIIVHGPQNLTHKNVAFLNAIAECAPEFFMQKQINDELRLLTLQTLILKTKSAYFFNSLLNIVNIITEKIEAKRPLNETHLEEFYSCRNSFYMMVFIDSKTKFRPDLLGLIEGCHLVHSMHSLCNLYFLVYLLTSNEEIRRGLIEDLLEIYNTIKNQDCIYIFNAFKKMLSIDDHQVLLLKTHFKQFKAIYRYDNSQAIRDQVKIICEIISENSSRRSSLNSISIYSEAFDLKTEGWFIFVN